jgi:putative cell wall-binding protein
MIAHAVTNSGVVVGILVVGDNRTSTNERVSQAMKEENVKTVTVVCMAFVPIRNAPALTLLVAQAWVVRTSHSVAESPGPIPRTGHGWLGQAPTRIAPAVSR